MASFFLVDLDGKASGERNTILVMFIFNDCIEVSPPWNTVYTRIRRSSSSASALRYLNLTVYMLHLMLKVI